MTVSGYRILDEPSPGALARFLVNPFWPLLSLMLGGAWIAWPWFAFNAFALGSATRRRELALIGGALVSSALVYFLAEPLALSSGLGERIYPYLRIVLYVAKVAFAYFLHVRQAYSLGLYEHFHGAPKNGAIVAIAAAFVDNQVDELLRSNALLWTVLS